MPPKRTGASDRGDERRSALVDALRALIEEQPYTAISITAIAGRAGLTRSAFYFYFPTKAAALNAVLVDAMQDVLGSAYFDIDSGAEGIRASIELSVGLVRAKPRLWAAVLHAAAVDREIGAAINGVIDAIAAAVGTRVDADRAAGRAPVGPDARLTAVALLGMNLQAVTRELATLVGGGEPDLELVSTLATIWTRALYGA